MSHSVIQGKPTAAQIHLDHILDEVVSSTGNNEDRYNIGKLIYHQMKKHPEKIHQIDGSTDTIETNSQVLFSSIRVALALRKYSVRTGDVIVLVSENHVELTTVYFGSMFVGAKLLCLDPHATVYELTKLFDMTEPKYVFTTSNKYADVRCALDEVGSAALAITFGKTAVRDVHSYEVFIAGYTNDDIENFTPADLRRDDVVLLSCTSGSTGVPKIAELKTSALVAQIPTVWQYMKVFSDVEAVVLQIYSLQWLTATVSILMATAYGFRRVVTSGAVDIEHVQNMVRKYKVTYTIMSPLISLRLHKDTRVDPSFWDSMNCVYCTGSSLPVEVQEHMKSVMRHARIVNAFGMTETCGFLFIPDSYESFRTVGLPVNTYKYKLLNESNVEALPHEPGELWIYSDDCLMKGYLKNEAETSNTIVDGWLRTGDRFYKDANDYYYFVDRMKLSFKYFNVMISPSELEDVITNIEGVHSAGVAESKGGGAAALVVKSPGSHITEEQINQVVSEKLNKYKQLHGGITFVSSLPLTATGKINRHELRRITNEM